MNYIISRVFSTIGVLLIGCINDVSNLKYNVFLAKIIQQLIQVNY